MANVDLKSLFTSEKSYTVLQLLNVLIDEVGKSMVKTASINQDVDAGTLTVTITLSDDSVITASTDLISLTDTEKSLISTLTSNVTATNEGVTFLKVVGFEGNETHKGNEIHNGYASFLGDENHAGTETHKGIIKTNEIDNLNGNAIVRYKDTEGKTVIGTSEKPTVLMGSTDRPYYSKDGSNFTGEELALKSDVPTATHLYSHYICIYGANDTSNASCYFSLVTKRSTPYNTLSELVSDLPEAGNPNIIATGVYTVEKSKYPIFSIFFDVNDNVLEIWLDFIKYDGTIDEQSLNSDNTTIDDRVYTIF